ncbi:MAG: nucleotidyltransferase domain-containing protein [Proteobacteria bacterium]|nr:nucleotidyltransferase domain-containing protein [Pseudomonadota bacterium]
MELAEIKQIIKELFLSQKGIVAVLLYGSYAKKIAKPDSDVDIAVLYDPEATPSALELWDLQYKLSELLLCEVELISLNHADPIIGIQVYKHHITVLINDQNQLSEYFARLLSDYAELKELIKPMEDHILERRYYGGSRSNSQKSR